MKPTTVLNVKKSNYNGLVNLGNAVFAGLTGNLAFTTPIPALTVITSDIDATEAAIAAWGPVGNRGSHADLMALRAAATQLYNDLLAEANYVQQTAQTANGTNYTAMAAQIITSGFSVKNPPVPQGLLGAPQNLHRVFSNSISLYTPKLKWKKPIGLTSPNNVKSYSIVRNTVNDLPSATFIQSVTKTSYIDVTAAPGQHYFYWVAGVNADGTGAPSMVLATNTPV